MVSLTSCPCRTIMPCRWVGRSRVREGSMHSCQLYLLLHALVYAALSHSRRVRVSHDGLCRVGGWGGLEFERVRCTVSFTCCCQGMSTHACMLVSVNCKCNTTLGCCILSPWCIGVPASWLRIWCSRGVLQCTRAPSTHMSCSFTMCNHCHMLCTTLCNLACIVLCTLMCLSGCLVGGDGTPKVCRVGPCNARVARPYRCRAPGHGAGNCLARRVCIIRCALLNSLTHKSARITKEK